MKKIFAILTLMLFASLSYSQLTRIKLKQIEFAPGIDYMVLTDVTGQQQYVPFTQATDTLNSDTRLTNPTYSGDTLYFDILNVVTSTVIGQEYVVIESGGLRMSKEEVISPLPGAARLGILI